jgi:hypothetical protein
VPDPRIRAQFLQSTPASAEQEVDNHARQNEAKATTAVISDSQGPFYSAASE